MAAYRVMSAKSSFDFRLAIIVVLSAVALLSHSLFLFHQQGSTCIDDAYISFAYARNLSLGHGLVMNLGERVEGYTNFLWVVLMAVVHRLGFDVPLVARLLNLALGLALIGYTLVFLAVGTRSRSALLAAMVAGAVLSVDGSLARWSQDGMETILFSLLALASVCRSIGEHETPNKYPLSSLYFAVATLTRPEGALLFAASLGFRLSVRGSERMCLRRLAHNIGLYCIVVMPYLGWRWLYYDDLLPNTFYAKVGATAYQILRGVDYVYAFAAEQHWPLLLLFALALFTKSGRRVSIWHFHLLSVVAIYLIYVIFVGGDWMGSGRFMVPILPLAVLGVAEMFTAAAVSGESGLRKTAAIVLALFCAGMLNVASGWNAEWANVSRARLFHQSRLSLAHWLREHARAGDTLLTNEVGLFAYYSGLYVADIHGLTDETIAHGVQPSSMGRGKAGHEKFDLDYSFSKKPTWICAAGLTRIYFENRASFPLLADYKAVVVDIPLPFEYYRYILHRQGADTAKPVKYVNRL